MKEISKIVHDERTYIESIGKHDKETVRAALADRGADTTLRMCFGMTGESMPMRALGYFASALAVQEHYFPGAELQFVYPARAAHLANGIKFQASIKEATIADNEAKHLFARRFRTDHESGGQVKSFTDFTLVTEELERAVEEVLVNEPKLNKIFLQAANKRGGNYVGYVAAHIIMHDINPALQPLTPLTFDDFGEERRRVISIGSQSERPFYLARMACQKAKFIAEDRQVETGQLFTRHILPPYSVCREGEPLLVSEGGIHSTRDVPVAHSVASVERDLQYLRNRLAEEQGFGRFLPQSASVDEASRPKARLGMMEVYYI